ncbi:MAG: IS21-like element helper ATPase IstB [Armatimonadota bacterium]
MMLNQTIEKLYDMRLKGMALSLEEQIKDPNVSELSFEERLGFLVDRQWYWREENRLKHKLKSAKLKLSAAVENIDYRVSRGLDKAIMQELASCRWIPAGRNLIITGPTGVGKTYLACALGEKACREGFSTLYKRTQRLVHELALARADGSYLKLLTQISKMELLILDDWALSPLDGQAQQDVLEVIDDRADHRSTLVTSQLPVEKWYDMMGDPSTADALLDRILGKSTKINLKGVSLRKEGKSKNRKE